MTTQELVEKYIKFFLNRGHKQIPNVSLVPENDPTLLFVNAGMFPLVPYLSGEKHPLGNRLVNIQRSLRTEDIDEIGDSIHTLAFHMIGNWSLGDYFKKEQLPWVYEFFIEELGLDIKKVAATVFEGDNNSPKDEESIELLKEIFTKYGIEGMENKNIFVLDEKYNWWQRGDAVGELGGPDSEIHYYVGEGDYIEQGKNPVDNEDEFVEIGNSVFMQYKKTEKGWEELPQKNVDFGGGLERIAMVVQNKKDIFETDNFYPIIQKIEEISKKSYEDEKNKKPMRILADHMRACVILAMDGIMPSNKDQGYVLRRLVRRMVRSGIELGVSDISINLVDSVVANFKWLYPILEEKKEYIKDLFKKEEEAFNKALKEGSKQLEKEVIKHSGNDAASWANVAFNMYQSLGYPSEIFLEDLRAKSIFVDETSFIQKFTNLLNEHQSLSRSGAEDKFKGGLADSSEMTVKYHTTAHLVQAAMQEILGSHVKQMGSNITKERMRYDFDHPQKLSDEEIKKIRDWVNDKVDRKIPVNFEILLKDKAIESGAGYMQHETYPDQVKVYYVGNSLNDALSKEFCGGPHASNTKELKHIEIYKQENIGKGRRRVYVRFV